MGNSGIGKSSIGRKIVMALSGLFLLVFLVQHLVINLLSIINPESFNITSHFMGTNPVVQFLAQPILIGGILVHYFMGIVLTIKNKKARPVSYVIDNQAANSSWVSRNMIITGIMIFLFLLIHMGQFWIHEITVKFFGDKSWDVVGFIDGTEKFRYWEELHHTMSNPINASLYSVAFLFLGLHLAHGFASTFQSVGFRDSRFTPTLEKAGKAYSVLVPLLFAAVAWCHVLNWYIKD
jgi:succinate dehydrogenase / fumarate reductase cytochrome b subunit